MRGQLRSMFYLLVRNVWFWAALVLVLLQEAGIVVLVLQGTRFGDPDSLLGLFFTPTLCCLPAIGVAGADQSKRGLRSSACAEEGRGRYVTSRFVAVAASTLAIVALTLALDGAFALVGLTDFSLIASAPAMHTPLRLLGGLLACLALAELALVLRWLTGSSLAALVAMLFLSSQWALRVLLVPFVALGEGAPDAMIDALAALDPVAKVLPGSCLWSYELVFLADGATQVVGPGLVELLVVPLAWAAAAYLLSRALMARRTL